MKGCNIQSYSIYLILSTLLAIATPSVVSANCSEVFASLEQVQPAMELYFPKLKAQTDYPWGKVQPYDKIEGDRITLTTAFDGLTASQKIEALELLKVDYNWPKELLTPERQEAIKKNYSGYFPAMMTPYQVFSSDRRLVSAAYDGCTRSTILTEAERYRWYYNSLPSGASFADLRNAGKPNWRQVKHSISPQEERTVRLKFWQAVGYNQTQVYWIAWVPERGHFEINVSEEASYQKILKRFQRVAPSKYRYVIVSDRGNVLSK
jgi:hypothetical protein